MMINIVGWVGQRVAGKGRVLRRDGVKSLQEVGKEKTDIGISKVRKALRRKREQFFNIV